jgi:PAS domain S-box-containing protein
VAAIQNPARPDSREFDASLAAGEIEYRRMFNTLPQIVWTCDADGRLEWVNDRWIELTGLSQQESISNKGALVAVHPDDRDELTRRWGHALATSTSCEIEYRIRSADGAHRWHLARAEPLRDESGRVSRWVSVVFDIHDRRQAEDALRATEAELRESEARERARADELAALMDAVPAAVWISRDRACHDVRGNRTGYEILRCDPGQNLSKTSDDPSATRHFTVFANGAELRPDALMLQQAATGVEIRGYEEEIRFDDGQVAYLYGSAMPLRDPGGKPRGAIGAFVDVTRLKLAEAALRDADRRKDEFLALLSHELRNPLGPIMMAAQIMQLRGNVASPEELDVILRQARHLVRLVDDLLDVSRVARGKVTLAKRGMEIAEVVAKAIEATAPLIEQHRHQLVLEVPSQGLPVEADEVRIAQVLNNLLTNAALYTPAGGRIVVTGARDGDDVVVRVRDNGVGIEPSLLPTLFEMFEQGERGTETVHGGLGLGLSLARTLTALHGGTVTAASDGPGHGSEFTVRLPAAHPLTPLRALHRQPTVPHRRSVHSRRVLVVDDNRDGAEMIGELLATAGHEVRVVNDPSHALSVADAFRPQIAVVDLGLPVMDGYTLGRELRARLHLTPPQLVALTGYGQEQDRIRSREAGFAFHLVKPVDAEQLVRVLDMLAAPRG